MHRVTVLPAYSTIVQYGEAVRADPAADPALLYHEHVVAPLWQQVAAGGEYERIAHYAFAPPTATLSALTDAATHLGALSVEARIEAAIQQAARTLRASSCLSPPSTPDRRVQQTRGSTCRFRPLPLCAGRSPEAPMYRRRLKAEGEHWCFKCSPYSCTGSPVTGLARGARPACVPAPGLPRPSREPP